MPQFEPVTSTASISLGVISTTRYDGTQPILYTTRYSDQAVVLTTTTSTRWGPSTVTVVTVTNVY